MWSESLTFYELLAAVRERPALYLGHNSVVALAAFLNGYHQAKLEQKIPPSAEETEFRGFDQFVCGQYECHDTGGWAAKIGYYYRSDQASLDEFFRLLDAFRARRDQ
jgi:hypothetical protein